MSSKFCESCGSTLEEDAKFCPACGTIATPANSTPPPAPQYTGAPVQNYAPPVQQQYVPPVQQYMPPVQQPFNQNTVDTSPMKVWQYMLTFILTSIPILGFILLILWSFGTSANINKRNYARAILLLGLIMAIISVALAIIFRESFFSMIQNTNFG